MSCELEEQDGRMIIRGEMTIYGAAELKADLFEALAAERDAWSLDLSGVSEIDTTGVQLLLAVQRACASRGASLTVADPSDTVLEAINLLRIHNLAITSGREPTP